MGSTDWFANVATLPEFDIFVILEKADQDHDPRKLDLLAGVYHSDEGKPWTLPVIKKARKIVGQDESISYEYGTASRLADYRRIACEILFGVDSPAIKENRVVGVQTIGGTGAVQLGINFAKKCLDLDTMYVYDPAWGNETAIALSHGFKEVINFRYWDSTKRQIDIEGMLNDLKAAKPRSVIMLHMSGNNPTGCDLTPDQWDQLLQVVKDRELLPFFDCAYHGFVSGCLETEAAPLRKLVEAGLELIAVQSFSKMFGLYGERVGNLYCVSKHSERLPVLGANLNAIARQLWGTSPAYGCRLVSTIFTDSALTAEWLENLKTMSDRVKLMRQKLYDKLVAMKTPGSWDHITKQRGMFSFTGLTAKQVDYMIEKYHVYCLHNGRVNMSALTSSDIDYFVQAIHSAVTQA